MTITIRHVCISINGNNKKSFIEIRIRIDKTIPVHHKYQFKGKITKTIEIIMENEIDKTKVSEPLISIKGKNT